MRFLETLSEDQLHRLYRRIYGCIAAMGGGMFGFDLITLKLSNPPLARAYVRVSAEMVRRREAG